MMSTIEDLKTRRSCRKFKDEQISDEELKTILETATYAPTGKGAQSPKIVVIQNPDTIKELIRMQTEDMSAWNIVSQSIVGPTGEEYCYWIKGYASVVLQDQESMDQAVEKINAVMAGESIE